MNKINSIDQVNLNLEEGRLLFAAASLLHGVLIQKLPEEDQPQVTPEVVFAGIKKRCIELFPDMKIVSSILSETGERYTNSDDK